MKKIISILAVLFTLLLSVLVVNSIVHSNYDPVLWANVEALTNNENDEFNCVMYKDECSYTIDSYLTLGIIIRRFPGMDVGIGHTVDLSSGTQMYREKLPGEAGVRCGRDITCNDFLVQLGLVAD